MLLGFYFMWTWGLLIIMSLYEGILIGGIQGITEWLPISSEGLITSIASLGFEHTFKQAVSSSTRE